MGGNNTNKVIIGGIYSIDDFGQATIDSGQFRGSDVITLSDAVHASLAKADTAIQEAELTGAIAAEAAAREKQDGLLQGEIDTKLQAGDLVAGDNIAIDTESQPGKVVISSQGGGSSDYPGAATDDDFKAYFGFTD